MGTGRVLAAVGVVALVLIASAVVYELYIPNRGSIVSCQAVKGGGILTSRTSVATFGAVTEYALPGPGRWPNAIATAADGSVWIAEQELPGVARLFPGNGTVVEYAWPGYPTPKPPDCASSVNISGIALWDGRVWAADEFDNRTIGLNPGDGSVVTVNSSAQAPFPYWLAVGPDGNLWFTSNNLAGQPTRLGRILPNLTLKVVDLVGLGNDQPIQLEFVNSTLALLATLSQASNSTTRACVCTGHIYSFDPSSVGPSITPVRIGGGYTLILPTSVSYSDGSAWVTQHGASSVVRYDFSTHTWTKYPTSIVPWTGVTLPLVVDARENTVWFNEHYANKIAMIDQSAETLTEFSESDPPPSDYRGIQNDLSIASTSGGLWFTSLSGNYIGFVNGGIDPGFHVSVAGDNTATALPGGNLTFALTVSGSWSEPMKVNVSDSENPRAVPTSIHVTPGASLIQPASAPYDLSLTVEVSRTTAPGIYTIAVTVADGLVQQTAYLFIDVK